MIQILLPTLILFLINFIWNIDASCPNHCNNHGTCDKFSRCTCAKGYQGADCSERICSFGSAWTDEAIATDSAHAPAECSNRGICNREEGICDCMEGFTGAACERLACSSDCTGNGICYSMKDLASKTRNDLSESFEYGKVWDADKMRGCKCDNFRTGYDCSLKLCPTGDDPLTTGQVNEVQLLQCTAQQGSFVLYYDGLPSSTIPYNANAEVVLKALQTIPLLHGKISVTFSQLHGRVCQVNANVVSIKFIDQFGPQNPLVAFLDPTLTDNGGSLVILADGVSSLIDKSGKKYYSVKGSKENDLCANRGICDLSEGVCGCFSTNGDIYGSSDGYGNAGPRGDCGYIVSTTDGKVGTCPGELPCSGHGVCDTTNYRCACSSGWSGGDCSEKTCPSGLAWFGYPSSDNQAHDQYEECSNMGLCDKITGKCVCRQNFYGEACQYLSCGGGLLNPCNGHGRCMSMAELALWAQDNGDATDYVYGSDPNNFYTWDYNRIHGCLCDKGYSGYDCSLKDCPTGDDPGTYEDHVEVQLLQCIANGGNFTLSFRQAITEKLSSNITAIELQDALLKLPTIGQKLRVYFIRDTFRGIIPNDTFHIIKPLKSLPYGFPNWAIEKNNSWIDKMLLINQTNYDPSNPFNNSTFCQTDGTQVAIIIFDSNHGDLPSIILHQNSLTDDVTYNGERGSGRMKIFSDGQSVYGLPSIKGTTEVDICNNRGLCDVTTGTCQCFLTWDSSDGARQGQSGDTGDCGYRRLSHDEL
eukprot:gene5240-7282_t